MGVQELVTAAQTIAAAANRVADATSAYVTGVSAKTVVAKTEADKAQTSATDAAKALAANDPILAAQKTNEAMVAAAAAHKASSDVLLGAWQIDRMAEWEECRRSIDRFDKLLVELRKTGLGALTAIATAATYITVRSGAIATKGDGVIGVESVNFSIFLIIILLGFVLYYLDHAHQAFLKAAVARATEIESELHFEITSRISAGSESFRLGKSSLVIYSVVAIASNFAFWVVQGWWNKFDADFYVFALILISVGGIAWIHSLARD